MTPLGIVFVCAYVVATFWGRQGVLVVIAASMAFNDSAAIIVGNASVTPFYLGLFLYLVLALFGKTRRDPLDPTSRRWPLVAFLIVAIGTSIVSPLIFVGLPVVAPGIGMDEQVGALSPLAFSLSSIAQILYVGVNGAFILYNERDRLLTERHIALGFVFGISVALWGMVAWKTGLGFPQTFFDNSPRGFYALSTERLRAQFAEPSHLGAFALTAAAFFGFYIARARGPRDVVWRLLLFAASIALMASASSGTAVVGIAASALALVLLGIVTLLMRLGSLRMSPVVFLALVVVVVGCVVALPFAIDAGQTVVASKVGSSSLDTRSYVDGRAWDIFLESNGFGVGLGNNRASSLAYMMLSTIGLVGCIFLIIVLVMALWHGLRDSSRRATAIGLLVFVIAACVSLADFASPLMWLPLALCYPMARRRQTASVFEATESAEKRA